VKGKTEYDFLTWTSFPSSGKIINELVSDWVNWQWPPESWPLVAVTPGSVLKVVYNVKQQGVTGRALSHFSVDGWNGSNWRRLANVPPEWLPPGTWDWRHVEHSFTVPTDVTLIRFNPAGGDGTPGAPGITWWDDLKIFQDGKLIYVNGFDNWNPYVGAGLGGVLTAVPAYLIAKRPEYALVGVIGALIGAGVGYVTAKP
jgi:hypothetical protein